MRKGGTDLLSAFRRLEMKFWQTNRNEVELGKAPSHPYFEEAYRFMKSWLKGQKSFNVPTSGSTGAPKVISIDRERLQSSALLTGKALQIGSGTRVLVCLSINYIAGIMMLVRGMELNWEITLVEPASNPLEDLPESFEFDFVAMVPMQLDGILKNPETRLSFNRIGKVMLGGAPVSARLEAEIKTLLPAVYLSYGMTETVSHVALRRLNGNNASEDFILLDNVTVATDERGCLRVSGPMTGYEWIQTNDRVEIISDRSFRWIGRSDSIINSGGVKIQLEKVDRAVEEVLAEMNSSVNFFTWFEVDERLGQKLVLFIETERSVFEPDRLLFKLRGRVSAYEVPKHVYFATQFSRTGSGKIDKIATSKNFNRLT